MTTKTDFSLNIAYIDEYDAILDHLAGATGATITECRRAGVVTNKLTNASYRFRELLEARAIKIISREGSRPVCYAFRSREPLNDLEATHFEDGTHLRDERAPSDFEAAEDAVVAPVAEDNQPLPYKNWTRRMLGPLTAVEAEVARQVLPVLKKKGRCGWFDLRPHDDAGFYAGRDGHSSGQGRMPDQHRWVEKLIEQGLVKQVSTHHRSPVVTITPKGEDFIAGVPTIDPLENTVMMMLQADEKPWVSAEKIAKNLGCDADVVINVLKGNDRFVQRRAESKADGRMHTIFALKTRFDALPVAHQTVGDTAEDTVVEPMAEDGLTADEVRVRDNLSSGIYSAGEVAREETMPVNQVRKVLESLQAKGIVKKCTKLDMHNYYAGEGIMEMKGDYWCVPDRLMRPLSSEALEHGDEAPETVTEPVPDDLAAQIAGMVRDALSEAQAKANIKKSHEWAAEEQAKADRIKQLEEELVESHKRSDQLQKKFDAITDALK